jgi:PAS domain S-box-containing protein
MQIHLLRTVIMEPSSATGAQLAALAGNRGHDVTVAATVEEARKLAKDAPPDLLLVRLNHETAADASALLREIREEKSTSGIFCIALTDDDEPSSRVDAWLKRGFDDFITHSDQISATSLSNRLAVAESLHLRNRQRSRAENTAIHSARRFEQTFTSLPDGLLVVTAKDGYIVEANPAAEQILGVVRADLVQRYLSLVLPDLFDHEDYDPQLLALHDTVRLAEVCHRRQDRSLRWLEVFLTKISWANSPALLLCIHDITPLREKYTRSLLDARQEVSGRIVLSVARELTDSLTAVQGNLELLSRLPSPRVETRELICAAQSGSRDAEELARKLSALGRKQQHHAQDIRRRPLALRPVLEKTVAFALLGGKCRPVLQCSDDLWQVEADESLLADAIRRIVENADQAMINGGTLFVDARNSRETRLGAGDQTGVCIRFRDQGPGIPAEHFQRIFDPFYSGNGREGMGLTHAAAAIRAHGGQISVDSQPGEGAIVQIWLPVKIKALLAAGIPPLAPAAEDAATPALRPPGAEPSPVESKARVLFMDDEAPIRLLVHKILTTHGFDVYCTKDGQEAIDACRKAHEFGAPFDVLLMDLDVRGGMGGMEAVARLRAEFPNIKALLTTGYIDDHLLDSHREHGFLGVIPKPFQIERLVSVVGKLAGISV